VLQQWGALPLRKGLEYQCKPQHPSYAAQHQQRTVRRSLLAIA